MTAESAKVHHLAATKYRRMRWRNGGGDTAEIAIFPPNAALATFGWRISMATVETGGPFSIFPDVYRTLSVVEGDGMVLSFDDRAPVLIDRHAAPLEFPGDKPIDVKLVCGAVSDLNVMTRRGHFRHRVSHVCLGGMRTLQSTADFSAIFCRTMAGIALGTGAHELTLNNHDTVLIGDSKAPLYVHASGEGKLYVIDIWRC